MLNPADPRPPRDQLTAALRSDIDEGRLAPGDPLPPQSQLAEQFQMSPTTVKNAIKVLRDEGLITSRPGAGSYVRTHGAPIRISYMHERDEKMRAPEPADARGREGAAERGLGTSVYDLEFHADYERILASTELAERLAIPEGSEVLQRTYVSRNPGTKLVQQWSRSWIPVSYIEHVEELMDAEQEPYPGGTHAQLRRAGLEATRVVSRIVSRRATPDEQQEWGLMNSAWLLESRNTTYADDADRPLLAATAVYPADRVELEYCTELPRWQ